MNLPLAFARSFFAILSTVFMTLFMIMSPSGSTSTNITLGIGLGLSFSLLLIGFDTLLKRFNLRAFNITLLGLFFGYLMGQALLLTFNTLLEVTGSTLLIAPHALNMLKIGLFLFGTYLGTIITLRSSSELHLSIPFVKFATQKEQKKDILFDTSVLSDERVIDLCSTGLFDQQVVIPRFVIKELYSQLETGEEHSKNTAKKSLDLFKKLQELAGFNVRLSDTDFPELQDAQSKLVRLARLLEANILTSDITRVQMADAEGVKVINLHHLSNALKPLMEAGESMKIKVQRYGKEPRQGVGYLDDGTMVVINGGGDFIGETIDAQVLSVKHTSSGRMIFCNAHDETASSYAAPYCGE